MNPNLWYNDKCLDVIQNWTGFFFIRVQNSIFGAKAPAFTFVDPSTDSRLGNRIKVEAGVFSFPARKDYYNENRRHQRIQRRTSSR